MARFQVNVGGRNIEVQAESASDLPAIVEQISSELEIQSDEQLDKDIFGREFEQGERSLIGNIFERPGAAIRAAISPREGEGRLQAFVRGSNLPETIPTFMEQSREAPILDPTEEEGLFPITGDESFGGRVRDALGTGERFVRGTGRDIGAMVADTLTNPAEVLTAAGGGKAIQLLGGTKVGQKIGQFLQTPINRETISKAGIEAGRKSVEVGQKVGKAITKPIAKFREDFINQELFPRVQKLFQSNVDNFSQGIQSYMKRRLKAGDDLIKHISKRGANTVRGVRQFTGDSLDNIILGVENGFNKKLSQINKLYDDAFKSIGDRDLINIDDAVLEMSKFLKKNGFIDNFGKPTNLATSRTSNQAIRTMNDFFQFLTGGTDLNVVRKQGVGGVNKFIWNNLKNSISDASIKDPTLTKQILPISDALHIQAEKSGLKNIGIARKAFAEYMNKVGLSSKSRTEGQLSNLFKNKGQSRNLQEIDKYLGTNFDQTAKDVISARVLQKVDDLASPGAGQINSPLRQQLFEAEKLSQHKFVKKNFFEDLLGKNKEIDKIFSDIRGFKRNKIIKRGAGLLVGAEVARRLGVIGPRGGGSGGFPE